MPNWCYNQLIVEAPSEEELERFKDDVCSVKESGDLYLFDFNHIVPMPAIVERTVSPIRDPIAVRYTQEEWDALPEDHEARKLPQAFASRPATPEELAELENYNHKDWYTWSLAMWGTKWGASNVCIHEEYGSTIEYRFDTAWGPPKGIIKALIEKYPDFSFEARYRLEEDPEYPHELEV
jgi:Ferredoxin-like domain in Api92-like protein